MVRDCRYSRSWIFWSSIHPCEFLVLISHRSRDITGPRWSQMGSGIVEIFDLGFFCPLFIHVRCEFLSSITAEIPRVQNGPKRGPGFLKYLILDFVGPLFIHVGSKFLSPITAEIPHVRDGPKWGPGLSKCPILDLLVLYSSMLVPSSYLP